jgi:hypothetical protein
VIGHNDQRIDVQTPIIFLQATTEDNFALTSREMLPFLGAECDPMRISFDLDVGEISAVLTKDGHVLFSPAEATEPQLRSLQRDVESKAPFGEACRSKIGH